MWNGGTTYGDMTFCPYWDTCADGVSCPRRMDDRMRAAAQAANMWVSQFAEKPNCHKEKANDEEPAQK